MPTPRTVTDTLKLPYNQLNTCTGGAEQDNNLRKMISRLWEIVSLL